ncbi:MAG: preprotein translocase subunit SecE [Simkaniaceae bacterium]|nr:preprotein translocase subunit SecE [Simkaniaceae bacterium]
MSQKVAKLAMDKQKAKRFGYLEELKQELKKVSWTSKSELIHCTKIVIGTTFAFGLGIYVADLCIRGAINSLNTVVQWIAG